MPQTRYSLILANCDTGVTRTLTFRVRPLVAVLTALLLVPVGWSLYARWTAQSQIERLTLQNARLEIENSSYRATASDLSIQFAALQNAIANLDTRSTMDPHMLRSIQRLPDVTPAGLPLAIASEDAPPGRLFALLDGLLDSLDGRLQIVRQGVAYREALADATPVIWPADGWISGTYGYRADPFTGKRDFHPAVDISTPPYGNLVEIDHGFGLTTRYGHLSDFKVTPGDTVLRGEIIGSVGATGRATGAHVHYEVWAGDRTINPMRLLAESRPETAN
jgi:murein DD-endopeptidase MepM/ murein hydrolase activator NlpD